MEEHEVKTVQIWEITTFKNVELEYQTVCFYCDNAEELYMDEIQMRDNDILLKNAYRSNQGLLSSYEICLVRKKYGISQGDLCILLGWGKKTITRYESHQVQDKAHDTILRKIGEDPAWFLELLEKGKEYVSITSYVKYYEIATRLFENNQELYLRKAIEARYARYQNTPIYNGNRKLSLDKVVDVVKYFASSTQVTFLYKVKLMKLIWYADALSFKKRGYSITGLVYQALPMGAVPIAHESIIDMKDIPCEEEYIGDLTAYHFVAYDKMIINSLSKEELEILDLVIDKLGDFSREKLVDFMHREEAYVKTEPRGIIEFKYVKNLQL